MNVHELAQRLAAQQRHVPVCDDHGAAELANRLGDHPHRVPGAELLVLDDDQRSRRLASHLRAHLVPAMPDDDHDPFRVELTGHREGVADHAAPA